MLGDVFNGKARCSLSFGRTSSSLIPFTSRVILFILCFIQRTVTLISSPYAFLCSGRNAEQDVGQNFCCEPRCETQPWRRTLGEQDLGDGLLCELSSWTCPSACLLPLCATGLSRASMKGTELGELLTGSATEKADGNPFMSKRCSWWAWWRASRAGKSQKSGCRQEPVLGWSSEELHIYMSKLSLDLSFVWNTTTCYDDQVTLMLRPVPTRLRTSISLGFSSLPVSLTWCFGPEIPGKRTVV